MTAACMDTLEHGPALLKWTEGTTGNQLQRLVRLADAIDPPFQDVAARLLYSVQLFAEDPRAYSQTATVSSGLVSGGGGGLVFPIIWPVVFSASLAGALAILNAGSRKTPPLIRIYGQCVNPAIVLQETGERITLSGTINLGDYVEIDTQARTLMTNGVTNASAYLDSASTQWFELPRGVSTLRLTPSSFDTNSTLYVTYRSAFA